MLPGLAHCFGEFRAVWRDILPERWGNPNSRIVALDIAVQWKQDAAFDESRQNGCGEVSPNFVLAQPSRFTAGVETFGAEGAQIVVPVVRGNVSYSCRAVRISRSDDCVQCQSIETICLRQSVQQGAETLGEIGVATQFRAPGGGLTGVSALALGGVIGAGDVVGVVAFTGPGWVAG